MVDLLAHFVFFLVILILEAVTDGRCMGWLEPIPDFTPNLKEGVTETRSFYCNCCCEIHTEPGILFCILTSSWLQDFSCLHLYISTATLVITIVLFSGLEQTSVAGSMVGVRLGLSEHIKDTNAIFSLELDEEDMNSITEVSKKGRNLMDIIGDCGDEYRA